MNKKAILFNKLKLLELCICCGKPIENLTVGDYTSLCWGCNQDPLVKKWLINRIFKTQGY